MRKIREVLRLKWQTQLSNRQTANSCNLSASTVSDRVQGAEHAGLTWDKVAKQSDEALETLLYGVLPTRKPETEIPDWKVIYKELQRRSVTLKLLWWEYKDTNPHGFQYSQFCHLYRQWASKQNSVMIQRHVAGEKVFVDWAGETLDIVDRSTGEVHKGYLFLAVLGASNYIFAHVAESMELRQWILAHCLAFEYFMGVPKVLVPDNLATGVTKPCFYDPFINPTYADMARHYNIIILPARVRPNDKSKAEQGVL